MGATTRLARPALRSADSSPHPHGWRIALREVGGVDVSPLLCAGDSRRAKASAGLGVFAEVTGQAGDILGDEPADGAAGVDADDDPAAGVEDETGGLQVGRVGVDEGAGRVRDGGGVGAVTDREPQAVPAAGK